MVRLSLVLLRPALCAGALFLTSLPLPGQAPAESPEERRAWMRTLAEELKQDLQQIDAAVDQFAIRTVVRPGRLVSFAEMSMYLTAGSRVRELGVDPLGTSYPRRFVAGSRPRVPAASAAALASVVGAEFWAPFVVENSPVRLRPAVIPPMPRAALPAGAPTPAPVVLEPGRPLPKANPTPQPTPAAAPPVVEATPAPTPVVSPLAARVPTVAVQPTPAPAETTDPLPTPLPAETSEEQARLAGIARSIRDDLQLLQAAIERYATEKGQRSGSVTFDQIKVFLKPESRLAVIGTDQLGNGFPESFRLPSKGGKPSPDLKPAAASKSLVAAVTPPGFWAPFE